MSDNVVGVQPTVDDERSETGIWLVDGGLVTSQPEEGEQIVPPGSVITPAMKARLKRLASDGVTLPVDEPTEAPEADEPKRTRTKRT